MSDRRRYGAKAVGILAGAGLLVAWTATAGGAQEMDSRWLPFLGCWEAVDQADAPEDDGMLCVRPSAGGSGVELLNVTETGRITAQETLRADGQPQEFAQEGCQGSQSGEFSADGSRVYVVSEQTCEGGVRRASNGVLSLATPYEWVDVQEVSVDGEGSAWTIRYRLASAERTEAAGMGDLLAGREMAVRSARIAAARAPEVDDVLDVYEHVGAGATEAWVVESNARFDLDAEELVNLSDAGVPDNVIDVVVAVSYPERFALDRDARVREVAPEPGEYANRRPYGAFYDPYRYDPFYYSRFGRFGYNRFGPGFGYYGGYYSPVVVRVEPRRTGPLGRVVDGVGWVPGGSGGSDSGRTARRSGSSGGTAAGSTRGGTTGSGASRGSSGSGGGSSTGRRAKRRGGGGGGGLLF